MRRWSVLGDHGDVLVGSGRLKVVGSWFRQFKTGYSVVVDDLNILCLAVPSEDDSILIVDSNAPFASEDPRQRFKSVAGRDKIVFSYLCCKDVVDLLSSQGPELLG